MMLLVFLCLVLKVLLLCAMCRLAITRRHIRDEDLQSKPDDALILLAFWIVRPPRILDIGHCFLYMPFPHDAINFKDCFLCANPILRRSPALLTFCNAIGDLCPLQLPLETKGMIIGPSGRCICPIDLLGVYGLSYRLPMSIRKIEINNPRLYPFLDYLHVHSLLLRKHRQHRYNLATVHLYQVLSDKILERLGDLLLSEPGFLRQFPGIYRL